MESPVLNYFVKSVSIPNTLILSTNFILPSPVLARSCALATGIEFPASKKCFITGLYMLYKKNGQKSKDILTLAATINWTSLLLVKNAMDPSTNWLLWFPQKITGPFLGMLCKPSTVMLSKNWCIMRLIRFLQKT
jgi:hypothetical protein